MGTSPIDPMDLMVQVIEEHSPESIWQNSPLAGYRQLGNTNRGQIGEDFIRRYIAAAGISVSNGSRTAPTDLMIAGQRFEIKTASHRRQWNIPVQSRSVGQNLLLSFVPGHMSRQDRFQCLAQGRNLRGRGWLASPHGRRSEYYP